MKWWLCIFAALLCGHTIAGERYEINALCHVDIHQIEKVRSSSNLDIPEHGWQKTQLPDNWSGTWPNYNGGAWYKINWQLVCKDNNQLVEPIAFSIDYINSAGAAYLNGDLLWSDQNLEEPISKSWNVPRYWIFPISALKKGENEILIYVTGYSYQKAGLGKIEFNNLAANSEKHLDKVWDRRTLFQINVILSGTIGGICFIIWMFRRSETTFGWMALSTFFWILFISNILTTEYFPFNSSIWGSKANAIFFITYIQCFSIYLLRFLGKKPQKLEQISWGILVLFIIALCISSIDVLAVLLNLAFIIYILQIVIMIGYVTYTAAKTKNGELIFLAVCLLSILFFMSLDIYIVSQAQIIDFSPLSPYTSPVITVFVVLILGLRLNKNLRKIEEFNQKLEHKVKVVSNDLKHSLDEKHRLEIDNVRLQERIHLSHELHDGLGASIVRSMILVDQSQMNIPNKHFLSMLKLLRDDLRQIIDSGSSIDSKVPETPIFWIAPVRYRFTQLMEELDIRVKWDFPKVWLKEPTAIQCLTLIRVVEESLTNVIKHSQATEVFVGLTFENNDRMILTIQDNGVGFDTESVQQNGLSVGMRSMHLRVEKMGGALNITSTQGCTCIEVTLSLG